MRHGYLHRWYARLLYRGTLALAASLGVVVILAPFWSPPAGRDTGAAIWYLCAHDATLRKTILVSALGLWVTAVVFFRPREPRSWAWRRGRFVSQN